MKDTGIFLGCKEKQRDFFGMLKKSSDFFGKTNSEVVIFLGIKNEPLSYPPPPVIKICEWGPWAWEYMYIGLTIYNFSISTSPPLH